VVVVFGFDKMSRSIWPVSEVGAPSGSLSRRGNVDLSVVEIREEIPDMKTMVACCEDYTITPNNAYLCDHNDWNIMS